jgi:hypothetical protein
MIIYTNLFAFVKVRQFRRGLRQGGDIDRYFRARCQAQAARLSRSRICQSFARFKLQAAARGSQSWFQRVVRAAVWRQDLRSRAGRL